MQNTYINIQSWMVGGLGLKNNELLIYAIIYGFCQDGKSHFVGGRSYLAMWTNSTVRNVQNNLNSLLKKGLIGKEEKTVNGVKACEFYPINLPWDNEDGEERNQTEEGRENISPSGKKVLVGGEKSSLGVGKKVPQGGEKSSPNNIKSNIKGNIESSSLSDNTDESTPLPAQKISQMAALVVDKWNGLQEIGIKPVSKISVHSARYEMLRVRLREYGLEAVLSAIEHISKSKFLRGHNKNGWMITFDWFVRPNNFPKVLEGNYDDCDENIAKGIAKGGSGYGNYGPESGGYSGGNSKESGQGGGTKGYDPRDFLGDLLDT